MKLEDQKFLITHLEKSRTSFEDAIRGVDHARWITEPAPGRWSIGLCAEHVVIVAGRILGLVQELPAKPEEPANEVDSGRKDAMVLRITEIDTKVQSPEAVHPVSKFDSPEAALAHFHPVYQNLNDLVEQNPTWLRDRFQRHPFLQKLDGYQWILAASCHTLRHVGQIREIQREFAD